MGLYREIKSTKRIISMKCKHCGSDIMIKDGIIAGKQRWKCKKCHKTTREGDKRSNPQKYPIWKKILAVRLRCEGKKIYEIAHLVGAPSTLVQYWLKNYETIMKNELKTYQFPKDFRSIALLERKYWKKMPEIYGVGMAFGVIWTEKGTKVFILESD